ncbi:hypothetical protein GOP47_0009006 [Adiantum capillus-veneris]|uniref:Uncharacterized protein n=1 Tax=Adiantum capillus-veneris TaxID=13818 RepID=A0A9D4UZY6_ADICA|nr:hypothetical protein GOP47_0009006 [Adiantum capillus-veneris]
MAPPTILLVKKLFTNVITPSCGSTLAAGYDVSSAYDDVVPTRGKLLSKLTSPLQFRRDICTLSAWIWYCVETDVGAGVIDADYRGHPVGVVLFNFLIMTLLPMLRIVWLTLFLKGSLKPEVMDNLEAVVIL